ncbi:recombinase family protein [Phaeacidiphilus oryzae]|uniref:recombinase family protein n=1 Tax=Phaeacidiphilus oryzae TaxID=348818 RepID=UPI00068A62C0|nr:recombinase family protein [Phaeacidiphilus oryzae]
MTERQSKESGSEPTSEKPRRRGRRRTEESVRGESAAIYCRISHAADDDQTGVDRQEEICREIADRLGVTVDPKHVYIDNNRSAWKRDRQRPYWDSMLIAMQASEFRHVIAYHPDRLMRQPRDLEDLLQISDEKKIVLHGQVNRRDLSDPDDRFILRIEVAHACRSSDDASRRIRDKFDQKAEDGTPHGGKRIFGYQKDRMTLIPQEAEIIREIFERFLDGESARAIAVNLNEREIPTASAGTWNNSTVLRILDSRHVAGIHVFRGEEIGAGRWPAIVDLGTWQEVRERRKYRAAQLAAAENRPGKRFYLLRGLVLCKRCEVHMSGCRRSEGGNRKGAHFRSYSYQCNRSVRLDNKVCHRRIDAEKLEDFVQRAAIRLLQELDLSTYDTSAAVNREAEQTAIAEDEQQLRELNMMWARKQLLTSEYLEMKKVIQERLAKAQSKSVVRPVTILDGIAGPNAKVNFEKLTDERKNAVLRFLFNAVIIDESSMPVGEFDYDRIDIDPNPL